MPDIGAFFTATLKRQLMPQVNDQIVNRSEILKWLKSKGCIETGVGGDGFTFRVRNSESAIGGSTSDWGQRNFQTTQPFTSISDAYRQYSWMLAISLFQMQRNEKAGPEAKMFKMATEQLNEVRQSATARLSTHAYGTSASSATTGDVSTPINGLEDIIDDDNTFQGVDRSATAGAYFRAQVVNVTTFTADTGSIGVTDGVNGMEQLFLACSKGKQMGNSVPDTVGVEKDPPDGIITTANLWRAYQLSLMPQFRYAGDGADPSKTVKFHGIDVVWDDYCTSGRMYFLNSRALNFDVVGEDLISVLHEDKGFNPPAQLYLLGGQYQFYSQKPRYLGALRVTNI